MTSTTTQQHFALNDEVSDSFLGADTDLTHVIADAKRLVLSRRYSHLQIQADDGTIIARVYRSSPEDRVWVAYLLEDTVEPVRHPSDPALFDQDAPEQLQLPGMEGF